MAIEVCALGTLNRLGGGKGVRHRHPDRMPANRRELALPDVGPGALIEPPEQPLIDVIETRRRRQGRA